jgi:hypothetical protein
VKGAAGSLLLLLLLLLLLPNELPKGARRVHAAPRRAQRLVRRAPRYLVRHPFVDASAASAAAVAPGPLCTWPPAKSLEEEAVVQNRGLGEGVGSAALDGGPGTRTGGHDSTRVQNSLVAYIAAVAAAAAAAAAVSSSTPEPSSSVIVVAAAVGYGQEEVMIRGEASRPRVVVGAGAEAGKLAHSRLHGGIFTGQRAVLLISLLSEVR